jgi:hypothetical protein
MCKRRQETGTEKQDRKEENMKMWKEDRIDKRR